METDEAPPDEQAPFHFSARQRRANLSRRAAILGGAGLGITVVLVVAIQMLHIPVPVYIAALLLLVWWMLVFIGVRGATARIAATNTWGVDPMNPSHLPYHPEQDRPIKTEQAELANHQHHDYTVNMPGPGQLVVGVGVLSRKSGRMGSGSVGLEIRIGERVITADEGLWGAYAEIPVERSSSWTIRILDRGAPSMEYLLSYQFVPVVRSGSRSKRAARSARAAEATTSEDA